MIKTLTKYWIARHRFIRNVAFLLLSLCIINNSFADQKDVEDFPWHIFYPAFIKKSIDKDKDGDGFTEEQGDCNDSDPSINPNAIEICGDGIDQDCDVSDLPCPPCTNIAGNWHASETVTITCCLGGDCETDTFSGTDITNIQQNECNISYDIDVSGFGSYTRTGTINGNKIQLSGLFVILQPWCNARQNNVDINGTVNGDRINLKGSGIVTGTCDGDSFSCTRDSSATLTRSSSSATGQAMTGKEFTRESSTQLLNNCIKILTIMDH